MSGGSASGCSATSAELVLGADLDANKKNKSNVIQKQAVVFIYSKQVLEVEEAGRSALADDHMV